MTDTPKDFNECLTSIESRTIGVELTTGCIADLNYCIHAKINFASLLVNVLIREAPKEIRSEVIRILQDAIDCGSHDMKLEDFWGLDKQ